MFYSRYLRDNNWTKGLVIIYFFDIGVGISLYGVGDLVNHERSMDLETDYKCPGYIMFRVISYEINWDWDVALRADDIDIEANRLGEIPW